MLLKSFSVGSLFGVPVRIQGLFVAFFALLCGYFVLIEGPSRAMFTSLSLAGAFVFVVAHEFGHALVAKRLGVRVIDVTIWPLGGMARLEDVPISGPVEIAIAAAGPTANLLLAALFFCTAELAESAGMITTQALELMAWINVLLAAFNALPAFPLDGGRILRSVLSGLIGHEAATRISVLVGQGFGLALGLAALYFNLYFLVLVAVFIFVAAGREVRGENSDEDPESLDFKPRSDGIAVEPDPKTAWRSEATPS